MLGEQEEQEEYNNLEKLKGHEEQVQLKEQEI